MNSRILFRFTIVPSLLLAASACTRTLSFSAANPERPALEEGRPTLQSQGTDRVDVVLLNRKFSYKLGMLPAFYVKVWNGGDTSFEFSIKNITAYSGKARVPVYTRAQLAAWVNRDAELEKLQEAHTTWEVRPDNPGDSSGRQAPTALGNMQQAERIRNAGMDRTIRWRTLLRRQLVEPGQTAGGVVKLEAEAIKTGQPLYLIVTVAGEVHRFVFDVGTG